MYKKLTRSTQKASLLKVIGKIIFLISLAVLCWYSYHKIFFVTKVDCTDDFEQDCPEVVMAELESLIGENLLQIETEQLESKIINGLPAYTNFELEKELPSTLHGRLTQAEELLSLKGSSTSARFIILDNLYVDSATSSARQDLPSITIRYPNSLEVGRQISDDRLIAAISLLEGLQDYYISFDNFSIASNSASVSLNSGQTVYFNPDKNVDHQMISLQVILNTSIDPSPEEIDLRYEKPVIRYANDEPVLY